MSKYGFKELMVWQRAKNLAVSIYKLRDHGPIRLVSAVVTVFGLLPLASRL